MKSFSESLAVDIAEDVYSGLKAEISSEEPGIARILADYFTRRGKVVRPGFMHLIGTLLGGSWETMTSAAIVIEAIHMASLMHDDVMDDSPLRRGEATLNAQYSDKLSVMFGDLVFLKALDMARSIDDSRAPFVINQAVERMITGEICEEFNGSDIDENAYLKTIGDKTASLFAASGELAAMLSGCDETRISLTKSLGEYIGMAFQIVDDTLDFVGDTDVMGKPRHNDALSGSYTLPVIYAMRDKSNDEIEDLTSSTGNMDAIIALVRDGGGIEYAHDKAREYSEKAREVYNQLGIADEHAFDEFLELLLERVK